MKPFLPGPATKAFYDQLITIANAPAYQAANLGGWPLMRLQPYTLPSPPPDPIDYLDRMFLHNICMPLYNAVVAAYQADVAAQGAIPGSNPAPTYVPPGQTAGYIDPGSTSAP